MLQLLPQSLRELIQQALETAQDRQPGDFSFVEQVLSADLDAILEAEEAGGRARLFTEVLPLQVSDLIALILLHGTPETASETLLSLPASLQAEVLHKLMIHRWDALSRRLGRAEVDYLRSIENQWQTRAQDASPEFAARLQELLDNPDG